MKIEVEQHDRVIALNWLRCGQPRPYADAVYEAELTFTGKNTSTKPEKFVSVLGCHPTADWVRKIAHLLVHEYSDSNTGMSPYLSHCTEKEKGDGYSKWLACVVVPFTD